MATLIRNATLVTQSIRIVSGGEPAVVPKVIEETSLIPATLIAEEAQEALNEPKIAEKSERELLLEEIESLKKQGFEEGFQTGLKAGQKEGAELYDSQIETLKNVTESIKQAIETDILGQEEALVEIAFEAICKVMGETLQNINGVRAVVKHGIDRVKDQGNLTVRVAPADFQILELGGNEFLGYSETLKISFIPDDRVVLGGCIIETPGGSLDGRLETQLQLLKDTLLGARKTLAE